MNYVFLKYTVVGVITASSFLQQQIRKKPSVEKYMFVHDHSAAVVDHSAA